MNDFLLVNDIHLGVLRSSGTTPASADALRANLQMSLRELMLNHLDKHIVINGDLFDTFNVPLSDVFEFYRTAMSWLFHTPDHCKLVLGRGNHDWSKDSSKLSSFDFIASLLRTALPERVIVVTEPQEVFPGVYMIPHMPNQDLFNLELERIPEDAGMVLVHANYDNNFAVEADHSLNLSHQQAVKIIGPSGEYAERFIVFGHEHQAKNALAGHVMITGNQWPSSVADCQHNPDGCKYAHVFRPNAEVPFTWTVDKLLTWDSSRSFQEQTWDNLAIADIDIDFTRVCGTAAPEHSADALKAIADFRKRSTGYVVTNAVKVEGINDMEELKVSMEEIKTFDVLGYLFENLTAEQGAAVKGLLEDKEEKEAA
jgi:DNA repair exonuclease SbcCD nuclease subunit